MTSLERVKITWTGMPGGPGVTQLYATSAAGARTALQAWVSAWKYLVPDNTTLTIEGQGDIVDSATGQITGTWTDGANIALQGTGSSGQYFAAGGACVSWATNGVVAGRRVKGRTFLVPLTSLAYAGSALVATTVSAIQGATDTMLASGNVWWILHRPTTKGGSDGAAFQITGGTVKNHQAILSSRRP
jgi:hypothetical protein